VFTGKYSLGTASAFSFYSRPLPGSPREFDMWNVRYAVAVAGSAEYARFSQSPDFLLEGEFGNIAIFGKKSPAQSYFESSTCSVGDEAGNGASYSAAVTCSRPGSIVFKYSYYPYWRALLDGVPVKLEKEPGSNRIVLSAPAGQHVLRIFYERPLWERLLFPLSVLALLAAFAIAKTGMRIKMPAFLG